MEGVEDEEDVEVDEEVDLSGSFNIKLACFFRYDNKDVMRVRWFAFCQLALFGFNSQFRSRVVYAPYREERHSDTR